METEFVRARDRRDIKVETTFEVRDPAINQGKNDQMCA